jgi:hypothetical protein
VDPPANQTGRFGCAPSLTRVEPPRNVFDGPLPALLKTRVEEQTYP